LRKLNRQKASAAAVGAVAASLISLSLDHQAYGVSLITNAVGWHPWAMAVGIDLSYVSLEVSKLCCATEKGWKKVEVTCQRAVAALLGGSAVLNALAFACRAPEAPFHTFQVGAAVLGLAIPAVVYVLTQHAATLYLDASK